MLNSMPFSTLVVIKNPFFIPGSNFAQEGLLRLDKNEMRADIDAHLLVRFS